MKQGIAIVALLLIAMLSQGLVVRHDIPDQEFIELAKQYPQICHFSDGEGTLIAPSVIVTASHVAELLVAQLEEEGSPEVSIGGKQYPITKVLLHPYFALTRTSIQHDIALVQIKGKVEGITPAKLYAEEDEMGKPITIVGRGDVGNGLTGPQKLDKITRAATNRIDGVREHWIQFRFDAPDSEQTTRLEGVSGPGDSGGPAFWEKEGDRYLIGVSSHQMDNGKQGVYGVEENYARVSFYKEWIEQTVAAWDREEKE